MRTRLRTVGHVLALTLLAGCSVLIPQVAPPSPGDHEAVAAGRASIVLLRVTGEIRGAPYPVFQASKGLIPRLERLGVGPTWAPRRFLSEATREEGWIFLVLPPGTHYLDFWMPVDRSSRASWRLEVPARARLVYVGTLHLVGVPHWLLFQGTVMADVAFSSVRDESARAQEIARAHLVDLWTPTTVLLEPHAGGPKVFRTPRRQPGSR